MEDTNDDDCLYLKIKDAVVYINQRVNIIGAIIEFNLPKKTKGSDWCCSLKIVDQSYPKPGLTVNMVASSAGQLPHVSSLGDILQLSNVVIKKYNGEVNAVYNKAVSYISLYEGEGGSYSFLREMRQGEGTNLVYKVVHTCEIDEDEWMAFVWDGTDCPPVNIDSRLENERKNPLPLQLEPRPLPRDLLCTFPTVGTVLRVYGLPLVITGKWVKFVNILCAEHEGLWYAILTPLSKLRYVSNDLIKTRERSYNARMTSELARIPYWCFPQCSQLTEVDHQDAPFVTLMDVLAHSKATSNFRSIVRVVSAFPW